MHSGTSFWHHEKKIIDNANTGFGSDLTAETGG
jgi:hypothetical protein